MVFRPCIDLHQGEVKQIVGSSLREGQTPETNFVAEHSPAYFSELYRHDALTGGHVIMLGPGNEKAASEALAAFPQGLQLGGGIDAANAEHWLTAGAERIIVTSYVFRNGQLERDNLRRLVETATPDRLVLDLSCGRIDGRYVVMTDRWQQATDFEISRANLENLAESCAEFLIHATDVEGKQQGIDDELVALLGEITPLPTTYAGGVRSQRDIDAIERLGQGKLDFTVGSALDLFGGQALRYEDMVRLYGKG
ncbi:MAG: phosphoribosylformimino-5-aminoimidazole carboxamide ribotide isomerase [Candidatus Latescibacterota bacterium]|jgi:phosphoribosylformimino-5-aminoimidazole carboxamide ribotide isomerase